MMEKKKCGYCGSFKTDLLLCGACKKIRYCNIEHQKCHWKIHKIECKKNRMASNSSSFHFDPTLSTVMAKDNSKNRSESLSNEQSANLNNQWLKNTQGTSLEELNRTNLFSKPANSYSKDSVLNTGKSIAYRQNVQNIPKNEKVFENSVQFYLPSELTPHLPLKEAASASSSQGSTNSKSRIFDNNSKIGFSKEASGQSLCDLDLSGDNCKILEYLGPDWLPNMVQYVLDDLNNYGFCAVDNFLGCERAEKVLHAVSELHSKGCLQDGKVVSNQVQADAMSKIRGDKITWVTGTEKGCESIQQLVTTVDAVIVEAIKHVNARKLKNYKIAYRTKAMVACYPGNGARYVKHIDNPNQDGRCITAIYYVNKNWCQKDGGILRIYPEEHNNSVAEIEPIFDRMLFFWSDRRNPHEVLPADCIRYAITVWYFDQEERERYKQRRVDEEMSKVSVS